MENGAWKKNFMLIFSGQAVSQLTSSVLQFAIIWHLTEKTASPLVLSVAMLVNFLPRALLGPFIGVLLDRFSRKKIMMFSDLVVAAGSLVLTIVGLGGEIPIPLLYSIMLLRSVGSAVHQPCLQAITPQIVPADELTRCFGYSQSLNSISLLLSPALAAAAYPIFRLNGLVFFDVAGALVAAVTLKISYIPKTEGHNEEKIHVFQDALAGFRILSTKKGVMWLVFINALYTIAMMPTSAYFPLISMDYFGGNSTTAGIVELFFSAGLLLASLYLGVRKKKRDRVKTMAISCLVMSGCLLVTGFLPPSGMIPFIAISLVMGVTGPFYWGMYTPILQQNFANEFLGRVLAITTSISMILAPFALLLSGVFANVFGVEQWFIVAGILVLLASIFMLVIKPIRNCDRDLFIQEGEKQE